MMILICNRHIYSSDIDDSIIGLFIIPEIVPITVDYSYVVLHF